MADALVAYEISNLCLRALVRSAWGASYGVGSDSMPGIIAPDAHVEFIFQTGTPCRIKHARDEVSPRALVFALRTGTVRLVSSGENAMVAFRLAPAVASVVLRQPLTDCWDRAVPLADLIGAEADLLLEHIAATPLEAAGAIIEAWLQRRLTAWDADSERNADLQTWLLWTATDQRLTDLADELGFTARTLRRHCERYAGLSPKQMMMSGRILRSCVDLRGNQHGSLAALAQRLGFADQAAFTNAFKLHVGMTPARFRAEPVVYCEGADR